LFIKLTFYQNDLGKKVELSESLRSKFLDYYLKNSSDAIESKGRKKINESIDNSATPLQITKVPYSAIR
jgi:hypothetical protein